MRSRRPSPEHQAAVHRRLALLSAELAAQRPGPPPLDEAPAEEPPWWDEHTRVRATPEQPDPAARGWEPHSSAPEVPLPGRHAARRARRWGTRMWPSTLRGRMLLGPAQLAVVAVLVAVGLAVTCWWLVRGDSGPVGGLTAAPAGPLTDVQDPGAAVAVATADASPATVTVDVAGKVRRPGIAVLDSGSRVVDALTAAGGARPGVDLTGLNLARVLVDGEQVLVGMPLPGGVAAAAVPSPGQSGGPLVSLNIATETELDTLPEVGPVTAASILAWRDEHGGFTSVDELLEVDGIGPATLDRIAPYVTL